MSTAEMAKLEALDELLRADSVGSDLQEADRTMDGPRWTRVPRKVLGGSLILVNGIPPWFSSHSMFDGCQLAAVY